MDNEKDADIIPFPGNELPETTCEEMRKQEFEQWIEKNGDYLLRWLNPFFHQWMLEDAVKDIKQLQKQLRERIAKKDD